MSYEVNKITPKHDLSWYVKWIASFLILAAVACRATGIMPMWDLWFSLIGTFGWLFVGILWHDRALIVLNSCLAFVLIIGLLKAYFGA
tara:strand:- start:146 stop:409 length:264 start_codon:yes stop_codon:yes gene_type:complete